MLQSATMLSASCHIRYRGRELDRSIAGARELAAAG